MSAQPYLRPTSAVDRRTMGKYDVLCRLSTGGMSEIFLAYQKGLAGFRKIVVLKSILPDIRGEEEFVRMFLDEAKTTALFNHPHIAQVFDLDVDGETLFLAMEFVQGCTLVEMARACRQAKEPIPIGFTLLAVRDTALALHYAHTFTDPRGRKKVVIHRDVAEKNIMVTYEGTTKLLDFGIAKALGGSDRTSVGMVKGTSGYMSPEQIRGESLDARSDVFSLGVVLHECLTGMRLFHGKTPEEGMLSALREEVPPPSRLNPEILPSIDAVVLKALARERDNRYGTSLEFARAIEKAASGQMWHPEQSGELVQRHFHDRVKQTRELIQSTQASMGDHTGELKVGRLIQELQNARDTGAPVDRDKTRTDPGEKAAVGHGALATPERARAAITAPPKPKEGTNRQPKHSPSRAEARDGETTGSTDTREVTDPAGVAPPPPLPPPRMSAPAQSPVLTAAPPHPPSESYDDDDDIGAKTIPAAVLPGGLFAPPPELLQGIPRRSNPVAPPVPSAPPPPSGSRATHDTLSGAGQAPPQRVWETYDDESDPGVKTTIARPFEDERSKGRRLLPFIVGAVVLALSSMLLMFVLGIGPFAQPSGPQPAKPMKPPGEVRQEKPSPTKALEPRGVEAKPAEAKPTEAKPGEGKPAEAKHPVESPSPAVPAKPTAGAQAKPKEDSKPAEPEVKPSEPAKKPEATKKEEVKVAALAEPDPERTLKPKPAPKKKRRVVASKPEEEEEDVPTESAPAPAASEKAQLTLVMEPGLLVTLNGTELGTTPLFNKTVPTGRQVFKVFNSAGEVRTLVHEVKPGLNSLRQDFDSLGK